MSRVDAIIMASGLSTRMGQNKLLLPLGNSTVLGQLLRTFPYSCFERVTLVYHDQDVAKECEQYPLTLCHNSTPERGKSQTIACGIGASSPENGLLFMVADQPLLTAATIHQLVNTFCLHHQNIILPEIDSAPANPVIFPASLREELLSLTGDSGGREVIRLHPELVKQVPCTDEHEFYDVDTPAMYKEVVRQWNLEK